MKKLWLVFMLCTAGLTLAFGQEKYTIYFSGSSAFGSISGFATIQKERSGKITITSTGNIGQAFFDVDHTFCPLIPEPFVVKAIGYHPICVIEGNTMTETLSNGYWIKKVINGNTTTETDYGGDWSKTVVNGNTTTVTSSANHINGNYMVVTVSNGNTTTTTKTFPDRSWKKTIVTKQGYDIFVTLGHS